MNRNMRALIVSDSRYSSTKGTFKENAKILREKNLDAKVDLFGKDQNGK